MLYKLEWGPENLDPDHTSFYSSGSTSEAWFDPSSIQYVGVSEAEEGLGCLAG